MNNPDLSTLKENLDSSIKIVRQFQTNTLANIKIQSLLNLTVYALATRLMEGSVKYLVYNYSVIRGDSETKLAILKTELKKFNNPEFENIKKLFSENLDFDIIHGKTIGKFNDRDISFLNEIIKNRHRNVHASEDSTTWFNANQKGLADFDKEYEGLINILDYLEDLKWDSITLKFYL
ncbi:hypothetical protein [Leptospira sp. 'Mane']|uniref:hypothetical protein n=1 Tax=Leptospira sp. 'Mane' TaxID=3387407 RepID=UPI00398A95E7